MELDYDFIMQIIMGNDIRIIGSFANISRIYNGIEWIKYFLHRVWFNNTEFLPFEKSTTIKAHFDKCYSQLSPRVFKKYEALKKFIDTKTVIDIHCYIYFVKNPQRIISDHNGNNIS